LVCDFNTGAFPTAAAQAATHLSLLGVLEYIYDVPAFLSRLRQTNRPVVLSYCSRDQLAEQAQREALGWVNHFTQCDLEQQLRAAGFGIVRVEKLDEVQLGLSLVPAPLPALKPKRVGILSYANVGNFGDRLGVQVITPLLPAHAEVTHLHFKPFIVPDEPFDLLIVGIGNSLFKPLLTDGLLNLIRQSKRAIGIFGTQYREQIDPIRLREVVQALDHWYARYEEDALLYGQGCGHVSHLGDCLISQFPLAHAHNPDLLKIGDEVWQEPQLDRTITQIQQYQRVFSTRLHPLLCAFTSAQQVAYQEQRESGSAHVSGKFGALLHDVFGRRYAEGCWFDVDRQAVVNYKAKVQQNLHNLQQQIAMYLAE
jgi:hypothetical protein